MSKGLIQIQEMKHRAAIPALALSSAAAFVAAAATVLVLEPEDSVSVARGCCLTGFGLVFFTSLFQLLNQLALKTTAGSRWRKTYHVGHADAMDINNKIVSGVQALLSCVTGAVVCTYSCSRDFLHTSHYVSEAYAWFGMAYFFYDIWSMYKVYVQMCIERDAKPRPPGSRAGPKHATPTFLEYCRHEPIILLHHVFIGGFGWLFIVFVRPRELGDCVFGYIYLMELSTPLVSLRGVLSTLRLKATSLYLVNGLLMMAVFAVCRLVGVPYALWIYSRNVGMGYFETWLSLPRGCKISIAILMIPQFYWFYLMLAGALKMFLKKRASLPTPAAAEKVDKSS